MFALIDNMVKERLEFGPNQHPIAWQGRSGTPKEVI